MTKIYEALERLEERNKNYIEENCPHVPYSKKISDVKKYEVLHPITIPCDSKYHTNKLNAIYSGIFFRVEGALQQKGTGNVVQFVGSRPGEGTSTVARELAKVAVRDFGRRVMLIDMDSLDNSGIRHFAAPGLHTLPESVPDLPVPHNVLKTEGETLHITSLTSSDVVKISNAENGTPSALEHLQNTYDMVIIDSPPMERNQSNPFFPLAAAVVLVVEAEKTKHQVVRRSKENIERQGGNLIGIVLNKKEFHVPDWLYKKL